MNDERTMRLPEPQTFIADAVLRTLRKWHDDFKAATHPTAPWYVAQMDLDQLEQYAANLWDAWQSSKEALESAGLEIVIDQPSRLQRR